MQLNFDRIRFIDSLSSFQMPLSAFPKTFGLTELKKGYFPHLFNTPENQEYVGPIPAQHYYMPEVMSVSGRKAFEIWHAQQTGTFDFAEELVAYCESNVKLLKEGCLKFKQLFEEKSKFNPFSCMTIASACNLTQLHRNLFTVGDSTPITPMSRWNGFTGKIQSSTGFSMQETKESSEFPTPTTPWTGMTRSPRPCTNFKVVSIIGVVSDY